MWTPCMENGLLFLVRINPCCGMCSSRKNPYLLQGRSSEIPGGKGVLKAQILEAKYEAKLEFPGGGGGGEYGYFLELHNPVLL